MKTKYQLQIEELNKTIAITQSRVTALQAQQDALTTMIGGASYGLKAAAVALHSGLCTLNHDMPTGVIIVSTDSSCSWKSVDNYDDPTKADFTESAHSSWLERAKVGIDKLKTLGFTVTEPTAPTT